MAVRWGPGYLELHRCPIFIESFKKKEQRYSLNNLGRTSEKPLPILSIYGEKSNIYSHNLYIYT